MWPVLIEFFDLKIYSYPLLMGIAWGMAYHLSITLLKILNGKNNGFSGLFWGNFVFAWIGSKLVFLIASSGENQIEYASSTEFWLGGGFVFYGGLLTAFFYSLFYCLVLKKFSLREATCLLPALSISHAIGRVGCFMAGCCFGSRTQLPWGVYLHNAHRHPVQIYEVIFLLVLGIFLWKQVNSKKSHWRVVLTYLVSYSLFRFFIEFLRDDLVRGAFAGIMSSSQFISLMILFSVLAIFLIKEFNPLKKVKA